MKRLGQFARYGLFLLGMVLLATRIAAAPYASMVMDMRTGEVIASRNADTQLHPASLTKMMTLYIAFEAIAHGEISLDTMVTISANAAHEPPSKLGMRVGQKIALRYLIRAAAVKSANDAATAIGEAIEGSEAAFARRMNRTAKALGMTRTHFVNANGLTEAGHMSTARDMTLLGRHLFFDWPQYYNLFSRVTADAGGRTIYNTNRKFLAAYRGADGIKTGYTSAAGFNLVASAERGDKRIIATIFGGASTAARNAKMAELLDMGFSRVPTRVASRPPARPPYMGHARGGGVAVAQADIDDAVAAAGGAGKVIRLVRAPTTSIRPEPRPSPAVAAPDETLLAEIEDGIDNLVEDLVVDGSDGATEVAEIEAEAPPPRPDDVALAAVEDSSEGLESTVEPDEEDEIIVAAAAPAGVTAPAPEPRPAGIILARVEPDPVAQQVAQEVVTRMSTSGGRHWGINVGRYSSQYEAERVLLKTALVELSTLGEALRKVARKPQGFEANFVGLTEEGAGLACRRLEARSIPCTVISAAG